MFGALCLGLHHWLADCDGRKNLEGGIVGETAPEPEIIA
jgi:hypothetical protein